MNKAVEYRRNGLDCVRLAEETTDLAQRPFLLMMARAWHNLAAQAERNSKADLVYETPPPRPQPHQPAVQRRQPNPAKKRRARK
jgi:hypothetical protein